MSVPVLFPVFSNAVPQYRCALNESGENNLANKLVVGGEFGNETRHLTFDEAARIVGPWFAKDEDVTVNRHSYGCSRYKNPNLTGSNGNGDDMLTEWCVDGYVYEPRESQYPSTIVAEWDLVCEDSWKNPFSTFVYMFGMMMGFLSGGFLSGLLGRKGALYLATIFECAFGLAVTFAPTYEWYIALRFFLAGACTIKVASVSVMMVEITTARYRAFFSAIFALFFQCIYRIVHALCAMFIHEWRYLHLVIMIPGFIGLFTILGMPESPRWLVSQDKDRTALEILYKAYKVNSTCKSGRRLTFEEFLEETGHPDVKDGPKKPKKAFKLTDLLRGFGRGFAAPYQNTDIAKRSVISTLLFTGQMCAFFGMLFYTQVIRGSVYYVYILNALTSIPGTLISTLLYWRLKGRKKPLLVLYAMSVAILLIGGLYTVVGKPESEIPLIVCCNITLVLLGASLNMLFIYTPELFPSSIRSQGFGSATGFGRVGSMLCSFINQLDLQVGHGVPVIIYAGVLVLQFALTCCLPDTDGENLADVVQCEGDK
nr:solute carrier family 22 [Hymenolepis microstoma]